MPSVPLPALPAATVMLVRDREAGGVEVFMVRRTLGAAFAAGMYVFPGGKVDAADRDEELDEYVGGLDDATASQRLAVDDGGLAYWVAAIRECFEEAGVLLARDVDGGPPGVDDGDRWALHRGDLSMLELCRRHRLVLDAGAMRYVAHWVTPETERPRRFDTRFFLAAAPAGQDGVHDDEETVESRWIVPEEAMSAAERGEVILLPPTIANLQPLAGCATVADVLARADAAPPPPRILPKIKRDAAGRFLSLSMPGDADYDVLA